MIELMFYKAVVEFGPIEQVTTIGERAIETHLLAEAAVCRGFGVLVWCRVTAAGVGPEACRVIFMRSSALEQESPAPIEREYRKRAM
jgi:hypothetical protein